MGPDELALLQVLLQSGYTEEQAMQMLSSGALTAPGVAPPAVQQAMGVNYSTPPSQQTWIDPYVQVGSSQPYALPSTLQTASVGVNPTSGFMGQERGNAPTFATDPSAPVDPYNSGMQYANVPAFEDGSSLQFGPASDDGWYMGAPPRNPIHSYADQFYGNDGGTTTPAQRFPFAQAYGPGGGGRGVPVGGVNPNAYDEKERSYGGDARDVQTYGRDFSGDLGSIIRELVNAGRSAAAAQRPSAQRNPSRPSSPGRSASAPGQMKKAAGVQSARSFTPAATRASTPAPVKARTVTAPVTKPASPKPPTPKGSVVATRGKAIANTLTKPKSRF
jgi:hypothetical protein